MISKFLFFVFDLRPLSLTLVVKSLPDIARYLKIRGDVSLPVAHYRESIRNSSPTGVDRRPAPACTPSTPRPTDSKGGWSWR